MPDDGQLLIVELVLPDGGEPSIAKLADLEMLALTPGGRQRTISEYAGLLEQAGLQLTDAVAATSGRSAATSKPSRSVTHRPAPTLAVCCSPTRRLVARRANYSG